MRATLRTRALGATAIVQGTAAPRLDRGRICESMFAGPRAPVSTRTRRRRCRAGRAHADVLLRRPRSPAPLIQTHSACHSRRMHVAPAPVSTPDRLASASATRRQCHRRSNADLDYGIGGKWLELREGRSPRVSARVAVLNTATTSPETAGARGECSAAQDSLSRPRRYASEEAVRLEPPVSRLLADLCVKPDPAMIHCARRSSLMLRGSNSPRCTPARVRAGGLPRRYSPTQNISPQPPVMSTAY